MCKSITHPNEDCLSFWKQFVGYSQVSVCISETCTRVYPPIHCGLLADKLAEPVWACQQQVYSRPICTVLMALLTLCRTPSLATTPVSSVVLFILNSCITFSSDLSHVLCVNVELWGLCLIRNVDEVGLFLAVYKISYQIVKQTQSSKSFTFATVIDWIIFSLSKRSDSVFYIPPHCQLLFF